MPDPINGAAAGGGIPSPAPSAPSEPSAPYVPPPQPQYSPPSNTQFGSAPTPGNFPAQQPQYQPQPQYTPQPSYAPQPSSSVIRDALAQRGYDVSHFTSDDEVVNAFGEAYPIIDAWPQVMQNARAGMQYREHQAEFEEWMASRQQPQAPATPKENLWEAPPLDPRWAQHVKWDQEAGQYVPRDMLSSPMAVEGMNKRADWQREQQQKFWDNPYNFIEQGLKPKFQEMLAQTKQEAIAEWQAQQEEAAVRRETEQFLHQNLANFYALDQNNQPLINPQTGQAQLTPAGDLFLGYLNQVREMGVTDPRHIRQLALGMTQRDIAMHFAQQSQAPAGASPAQGAPAGQPPRGPDGKFIPPSATQPPQQPAFPMTPGQRSQAQLDAYTQRANGAYRQPNYGGGEFAAAANAAPQNPNASFGEMAIAELRNRGAVPHTG